MNEDVIEPLTPVKNNNNKTIWIVAIIIVLLGMLYAVYHYKKVDSTFSTQTAELKTISLTEIATHNTKDNCWTTINGGVYDITKFIPEHKGKEKILNACGVDATDFFTGKSPLGRVHSQVAVKLLESMKIGTLRQQ